MARQQSVQTSGCSASSSKFSSAASLAIWLLDILTVDHFNHAVAFQNISSIFFVCVLKKRTHVDGEDNLMSNFICLCGLLSKLDQGCNDKPVLAAHWLQKEITGSCKVLQLILAQGCCLKLKILATVTRNAQQRGSNPGYWFSFEMHKTMGETFPNYCEVGQEIFACMSNISPNIRVCQVR